MNRQFGPTDSMVMRCVVGIRMTDSVRAYSFHNAKVFAPI